MNSNRLDLYNIYKNFGNVKALKNVSMNTNSGQINCILGDNGAGKSTLVNIISGVFQQDEGEYKINDEIVSFSSPMEAMNAGISTVYQNLAIIPIMNIYRNFFLGQEPTRKGFFKTFDKEFAIHATIEELKKFDIKIENPK
jgi:simple sugar transport system ATP-binding protein